MTLERSLCISQDGEFSAGPSVSKDPSTSNGPESQLEMTEKDEVEAVDLTLCVTQVEDAEWKMDEGGKGPLEEPCESEEEKEEEATDVDLACSMQYDEEEIEQLNMMVHQVGDEMSTLLSPPSQNQSPAHRTRQYRGSSLGGSSATSSTQASPRRGPGSYHDDDRVFFMDDLEASITGEICRRQLPLPTVCLRSPDQSRVTDSSCNDWLTACQSSDTANLNKLSQSTESVGPLVNGWEGSHEEDSAEAAEEIATRTGGMKLSATVIFNPHSPNLSDLAVVLPQSADVPEHGEGGALVATQCLLNSCVCCAGGCVDNREDAVAMEPAGRGMMLGYDKHKLTITSSVIQSAVAAGSPGKGNGHLPLTLPPGQGHLTPPGGSQDCSQYQCCEKCPGSIAGVRLAQDRGQGEGGTSCPHQDSGCRIQSNTTGKQSKEDNKKSSRFVCKSMHSFETCFSYYFNSFWFISYLLLSSYFP